MSNLREKKRRREKKSKIIGLKRQEGLKRVKIEIGRDLVVNIKQTILILLNYVTVYVELTKLFKLPTYVV